jgi:hypothetical protein
MNPLKWAAYYVASDNATYSASVLDNATYVLSCFPMQQLLLLTKKTKLNSVPLVHKQTILTERPPVVSEVSANFCG